MRKWRSDSSRARNSCVWVRSSTHCETLGSFPGCGFRPSTKYGFGRKRTSNTRSLASGIPLRKPKLNRVRLSLSSRPGPPNFAVMASRSSWTFIRVVSTIWSARSRSCASMRRSSAMPSSSLPTCLRRRARSPARCGGCPLRAWVGCSPRDRPLLDLVADPAGQRGLRDLARELLLELLGGVMALQLEQVVARRHLDDGGQVAAGAHRDHEQRYLDVEDGVLLLLDAEPVVLDLVVPLDQLHHHLHLLALAHGGHAEEVLDVDDADPADLHVVLDDLRSAPVDGATLLLF